MEPWSVMYMYYVMYCNVWVGLIIIDNTRNKRVNEILFDVTHSENEIIIHAKFHAC